MDEPPYRIPDHSTFVKMYSARPPWDIDGPQPKLVEAGNLIQGRLLDSGCGTGENALYFAQRGCTVVGVDFVDSAIAVAKQRSRERLISAEFLVKDALTLTDWNRRFDAIIDSGVYHVFGDDDRRTYVAGLSHVLEPGGRLFMVVFRDDEPGTHGPRRIAEAELRESFGEGWAIEKLEKCHYAVRPGVAGMTFSEGGPKAWFLQCRRVSA